MSYKKAMKHDRNIRKCKRQGRMYMGFSVLGANERRKNPIFGGCMMEKSKEEMQEIISQYHAETERLLATNPKLKLV